MANGGLDDLYTIPIYSSWFSWDEIHDTEKAAMKEFFDLSSISRTPKIYKDYRDFIINKYRQDPSRRLTFTQVRNSLVGDVSLLHKLFLFLDKWGLINFSVADSDKAIPAGHGHKVDVVEEGPPIGIRVVAAPNSARPLSVPKDTSSRRPSDSTPVPPLASFSDVFALKGLSCGNCSARCYSGVYEDTKDDRSVICMNCFQNENFGDRKTKDDFRFNDCKSSAIGHGAEWTEAETLLLLESVLKHGDDWELVAQNVGTKSKLDCILKLIELPFGDSMLGSACQTGKSSHTDNDVNKLLPIARDRSSVPVISDDQLKKTEMTGEIQNGDSMSCEPPLKKKRVSSLPTAGSSLMKQMALMSAMIGPDIAAAAAESAVTEICNETSCPKEIFEGQQNFTGNESCMATWDSELGSGTVDGDSSMKDELNQAETQEAPSIKAIIPLRMRAATATALGAAAAHAKLLADQEDREIERLVATVVETQMKKVEFKMKHFEDLESIMEKEYVELEKLKEAITSERLLVLERALSGGISRWRDHPPLKS